MKRYLDNQKGRWNFIDPFRLLHTEIFVNQKRNVCEHNKDNVWRYFSSFVSFIRNFLILSLRGFFPFSFLFFCYLYFGTLIFLVVSFLVVFSNNKFENLEKYLFFESG